MIVSGQTAFIMHTHRVHNTTIPHTLVFTLEVCENGHCSQRQITRRGTSIVFAALPVTTKALSTYICAVPFLTFRSCCEPTSDHYAFPWTGIDGPEPLLQERRRLAPLSLCRPTEHRRRHSKDPDVPRRGGIEGGPAAARRENPRSVPQAL